MNEHNSSPSEKQFPTSIGKGARGLQDLLDCFEAMGLTFQYDVFSESPRIAGIGTFDGLLSDAAVGKIWRTLKLQGIKGVPSPRSLLEVIMTEVREHPFHPVLDWLNSLQWDNVPRLDEWLTTYLGVESTPLTRDLGRIVLIAAVRRVRFPGCKFDHILILEGPAGRGKSSAVRTLAFKREWFSDSFPPFDNEQKQIESLLGKWIIEYPELAGMRRSERERVKAFLSRQTDHARLAYARMPVEVHRQCIFIGTTEPGQNLPEQNRRFWPVAVGKIDLELLSRDITQLWAEAAAVEETKETIELNRELWDAATAEQEQRVALPAWHDEIYAKLGQYEEGCISPLHMWEVLKIDLENRPRLRTELGQAMKSNGFELVKLRGDLHGLKMNQRIYVKNPREAHIRDLPTIRLWEFG